MAIIEPFKWTKTENDEGFWELITKRKWNSLYIDPPHEFQNKKTGGGMKSGSSQKYKTMRIEKICSMPVNEITMKNSILFCWVPSPLSDTHGHDIFDAWGFQFKGKIYWVKDKIVYPNNYNLNPKVKMGTIIKDGGWGYNFRSKVEELWFGIKGDVKAFRNPISNVIYHQRIGHSIKPDIFRKIVEDQFNQSFGKERKMIEGFARKSTYKTKWTYFGDELRK